RGRLPRVCALLRGARHPDRWPTRRGGRLRLHHRRTRTRHFRTIHDRVTRLKTWTRWMRKRGWTERDRWEDVRAPQVDPAEFDLIDTDLRRAAFAHFDPRTFLGARNRAILALLSDVGLRRNELCLAADGVKTRFTLLV